MSQLDLIMEYFKKNPNRNIKHPEVVDWAMTQYKRRTGKVFRDPDRAIRKLSQEGQLIKIEKGVYKYDPNLATSRGLGDFTPRQKETIFKKDNYRCVVCGLGREDGVEICADHIIPRDKGGASTVENGQTLCAKHNLMKKNYSQTETGKRYFIKLYRKAVKERDKRMAKFCRDVFNAYNEHKINTHIPRPNSK